MMTWQQFLEQMSTIDTPLVDERQLDSIYNKAHIAVEIVRGWPGGGGFPSGAELLRNIATIGNLASGAYGIYSSGENKKILPKDLEQNLIYYGKINRHNLDMIPKITLKQYYPNVPENNIKQQDTIHVNVKRILAESKSDLEAILQISSTIIHEAVHEKERETKGQTSEAGPYAAERAFMNWAQTNMNQILAKYPELKS